MSRVNVPLAASSASPRTHEGAPAVRITPEQALRRSVLSCMLWEGTFYEDGVEIADRIAQLAAEVPAATLAALAVEARQRFNLRHAPLLLLSALVKTGRGSAMVSDAIASAIQRPDELGELLAVYWRKGKRPLAAQLKKGLARAMLKFDEYALAKYDRNAAIKLRDVAFLCHVKAEGERGRLLARLVNKDFLPEATKGAKFPVKATHGLSEAEREALPGDGDPAVEVGLAAPDTWEVALSGGEDKKATFERLLREEKLGYLALLRNLRGMMEAGVDQALVTAALRARKGARRVLPFRYIAAARACPQLEGAIDAALMAAIDDLPTLPGRTIVLVDVSGSMDDKLSAKSDMKRVDAAAALASIIKGDLRVFTFSHQTVEVPPRRGMAGVDAVISSQPHGGTYLGRAVGHVAALPCDRLIVLTDEQSHDAVPRLLGTRCYLINVASAKNGVGYGGSWTHLDGFSERVLSFIAEVEAR